MKTNLLHLRILIITGLSIMISRSVQSAELAKVGTHLKVMDTIATFKQLNNNTHFTAGRGSKFKIAYVDQDTCYIEFYTIKNQDPTLSNPVIENRRYRIAKNEITEKTCKFTRGWYAAGLTVPFKYRFELKDAPSALSTNFDISGAIGYSWGVSGGFTITPTAFVGLATIALTDVNSTEVETRLGLTGGLGLAFTISANFQIAFIGGADLLTGSIAEEWPYQMKPWISVGIGYKFLDF